MTTAVTEYAVKRCKQLGFIKSHEYIPTVCEKCTDYIMYITDLKGVEKDKITEYLNNISQKVIVTDSIDDIAKLNPDEHVSIYVELAHERDSVEHLKVEASQKNQNGDDESISTIITEEIEKYCKTLADKQTILFIKNTFAKYIIDNSIFDDCELEDAVLDALIYLYKNIRDTDFQCEIYQILKHNNYSELKQLLEECPIAEEVKPIKIYPLTEMFDDVEIVTMKDVTGKTNNTSYIGKITDYQDPEKAQQLVKLHAFSLNKFSIHHGKKYNTSIKNCSEYQNHDVLQTIYTNGVHSIPHNTITNKNLSIKRMLRHLHALKSFDIIFIHPNLAINGEIGESPSSNIQPSYDIGNGEIMSIMYRYIAVYFFSYCSVYDESIEELGYII